MGACRRITFHVSSAFQAEAVAALHAVKLLSDLGFRRVEIEGDSLTTIKKLQSNNPDMSVISGIIHEIKERAKDFFKISYTHTFRRANMAAHLIAGAFRLGSDDLFLVEEVPDCALLAVERDRPSS
ncbi:hypothetical protein HRI_001731300 [Hibiscus trionum]|uniref:RNase H type-1 domain-containing protein n=1 Tax=Hibiscus trionum TaxID=183268 RepID=A0A9W7HRG6_HIBTR|nr:hypothetical protein HRI_001731300 [Hibiscus trionum]